MAPISGIGNFGGVYRDDFQNIPDSQQAGHTTPSHSHKAPPPPGRVIKQKIQKAAGQQVRERFENEKDDESLQGLRKELPGLLESARNLDPRTAEELAADPDFQNALESLGEDERKQLQNALQKEESSPARQFGQSGAVQRAKLRFESMSAKSAASAPFSGPRFTGRSKATGEPTPGAPAQTVRPRTVRNSVPTEPGVPEHATGPASSQAISTDAQPAPGSGMPPVYRADARPWETIREQGFQPWKPFTLEESRDLLLHFTGLKQLQNCSFKGKITLANHKPEAVGTPLDLKTLIITSALPGPTISTDPSKDCGGYNDGKKYVYKIDCTDLKKVDWKAAIPAMKIRPNSLWPTLLLNADTLEKATTIAFKSPGTVTREVTFLTPIPANKIALEQEPEL